jgi:DNA-binding transcriptional LysR family regulator
MPDNRLVLIAPPEHKFASRKKVKVTDLHGEDFVLFERDVPTRKAHGQDIQNEWHRGQEGR